MNSAKRITVTSPLLPSLNAFIPLLQDIWKRQWLTNNGYYHQKLEYALRKYLNVPYISLFTNGTIPLLIALKLCNITSKKYEIITTPYSFVATSNSIIWDSAKPIFVDIDIKTGNIDPSKIEAAITSKTAAILPVHVYGNPCDIETIQSIADTYHIKVIYDAAHAFNVKKNEQSILTAGDFSVLSFHATKTYNTIEGGAIVCKDEQTKKSIDALKNFGYTSEIYVTEIGINGKLDEIRSAYGLLNLKKIDAAIAKRKRVASFYRDVLKDIPGISFFEEQKNVSYNYSYFPIFIDSNNYWMTRDELFEKLTINGILSRRYFYPLISNFLPYSHIPSASRKNLPMANKMSDSVLCLPIHHLLKKDDLERIVNVIIKK
ncbi:DegT/DnrJ/EryC1/StrS family aminotransferase [Treponema socranskii]|uniref:DegT/DnrJ/EryC1/StrS family aminotransferase n=1 Tax=Treponema socranskii TaxID=53419 RepID=UPI002871D097|nr:DegT/DnrJ/EryC1/StrS family aminotransferase [Treponema socranskii]MDR9859125.1 DegT/DnrJ/EryC1/StrS family aminotransferase [Treponema socranskii]